MKMKHVCPHCKKEFEGRLNKIYCSDKCRENFKFHNRRKGNPKYYFKQRIREKRWYLSKGRETKRKYQRTKKFRDYQNKWRRDKKYWLEQYENNRDNNLKKAREYRKTSKGKINNLKCNERRRKKNIQLSGNSKDFLSPEELKVVDARDIVCVYCKEPFDINSSTKRPTYDHLDYTKPLTLNNAVKCCWSCNSSKLQIPIKEIPEWIKRKGFTPSPIVFELLNKKNNKMFLDV